MEAQGLGKHLAVLMEGRNEAREAGRLGKKRQVHSRVQMKFKRQAKADHNQPFVSC